VSDVRLIFTIQAIRAFLYGFSSILIGASLAQGGLDAVAVGAVFTAILLGMAISSLAVARWGERIGRRRSYLILLGTMGVAGAVFSFGTSVPLLLVLAALTGTLSTDPNESGPITTVEQAMLASTPPPDRARIYGRYNAVAYLAGAAGALGAGGPTALRDLLPALPPDQRWLLILPIGAVVCLLLARRLSTQVEVDRVDGARRGLVRSRGAVQRLSALFAVDAFAGGFIVQAFIVFWFGRQFGADAALMGLVFFGVGVLQAGSSIAAGWLGQRIGLLNTMVFTHLPSNLLLSLVPLAPTLPVAIGLVLARSALSQMDVPARQAYIAALVDPSERTAAAGYTNAARHVVRPAGPALGSLSMGMAAGMPFFLAGGLKAAYDVALYLTFRRVRLPDDDRPPTPRG
jgi:MFS family permease